MEQIIKTIFPPKCIICGRYGRSMCRRCLDSCRPIDIGRCVVCQKASIDGETHSACLIPLTPKNLFCCFEYSGNVRECIRRAKYNSMEFDALKDLTAAGLHFAYRAGIFYEEMLVVFTPLGRKRTRTRGFNQAEVVARKVCDFYKLEMGFGALKRGKETTRLAELGRAERLKEMEEAFIANPRIVAGRKILLVDDVCTTGATLISCAEALMTAGAKEVHCFTVATVL